METLNELSSHSVRVDAVVPDYSVVIPVYFNEESLASTLDALYGDFIEKHPDKTSEIIFVEDGSRDGSLHELLRLQQLHPETIVIIKLTRNFGQISARLAGLRHARGKCVISMSADGQEPPYLANNLLEAHLEEHYDVVIAARKGRDESWFRILTSRIFYRLMRKLIFPHMPPGGFSYVLLSRRALRVLLDNQEAHPFFQGQVLWMGFEPKIIEFVRPARKKGQSRWTMGRKVTLLIDGFLSYSFLPIRLMSLVGVIASISGMLFAVFLAFRRILVGTVVEGWVGLMIVILIMSGMQMLMLGVLGEYLWRTLAQARKREEYVIDKVYDMTRPTSVE